uniref:Uncharacterized protein n=1 Tax=Melicertus latisulcatus pemonivirus TaxID=2984278 RepID=A0A9C7BM83_9VIRU|nr:MAG: hypothetical protein [Melicertus latisulcatus pemonivirus]
MIAQGSETVSQGEMIGMSQVRYDLRPSRGGTTGLTAKPSSNIAPSKRPSTESWNTETPSKAETSLRNLHYDSEFLIEKPIGNTWPATTEQPSMEISAMMSFDVMNNSTPNVGLHSPLDAGLPLPHTAGSKTFTGNPLTLATGHQSYSTNAKRHQPFITEHQAPAAVPPSGSQTRRRQVAVTISHPPPPTTRPQQAFAIKPTSVSHPPNAGVPPPNGRARTFTEGPQTLRPDGFPLHPSHRASLTDRQLAYMCYRDAYLRYRNVIIGNFSITPLESVVLAENFRVASYRYRFYCASNSEQ